MSILQNQKHSSSILLNLSNGLNTVSIDLKEVEKIKNLDWTLSQVLDDKFTICVGYDFEEALETLDNKFPKMRFFRHFPQFFDMKIYYRLFICNLDKDVGLKTVVQELLNEDLCECEKGSDWDKRPLTLS